MNTVFTHGLINLLKRRALFALVALVPLGCFDRGVSPPPFSPQADIATASDEKNSPLPDLQDEITSVDAATESQNSEDGTRVDPDSGTSPPAGICDNPEDCPCSHTLDCAVFDKMDPCNGVHLCVDDSCVLQPDTGVVCPEHSHPCKDYICDPNIGLCLEENGINGSACDDQDPCTEDEICLALSCKGHAIFCDDGSACTTDECVEGVCVFDNTCADGNPCTTDLCQENGACAFEAMDCDDEDLCTDDHCSMENGACGHVALTCDDEDPCTHNNCSATQGCVFPSNGTCDAKFSTLNTDIFEKKCVPCHAQGGPKRNFVGDATSMQSAPYISLCQNMGDDLPYNLAACIYWLTKELGGMPPPWYQAETLLPDEWTKLLYEEDFPLTEPEKDMIQQWAEQGFPP